MYVGNGERCHNGGECIEGPGLDFTCKCSNGWNGKFCDTEIDECEVGPCQNGGVCIDKIAAYACACPMGFTGTNCEEEVLKCDNSPCQNKALCLMEEGIPVCYCVPDYHGEKCENQYDECQLGPRCMNGGVCIDGIDDFTCSCPPGLSGRLCECLVQANNEMDCNYTAPTTSRPETTPFGTETTQRIDETTLTNVPSSFSTTRRGTSYTTLPFTQSTGGEELTTTGSRFSSTSFRTSSSFTTHTFRASTGINELPSSTISTPDTTSIYPFESTLRPDWHKTSEGATITTTKYNEFTTVTDGTTTFEGVDFETTPPSKTDTPRFSTRPTPGHLTTHEPTQPVPTDAPDHITQFFEFPFFTSTTMEPSTGHTQRYTTTPTFMPTTQETTIVPTTFSSSSFSSSTSSYPSLSSSTSHSTIETPTVPSTFVTYAPTIMTTTIHTENYTGSPDCAKIACLNGGTCTTSSINGTKVSILDIFFFCLNLNTQNTLVIHVCETYNLVILIIILIDALEEFSHHKKHSMYIFVCIFLLVMLCFFFCSN